MGDDIQRHEALLHARTSDWPGEPPGFVDPLRAWHLLGCPTAVWLCPTDQGLERSWLTASGDHGFDIAHDDSLLPESVVGSLQNAGCSDDLVILAPESLRSQPLGMRALADGDPLNCLAAVSVLPSLSWGARAACAGRAVGSVAVYLDPDVDLHRTAALLGDFQVTWTTCLADLREALEARPDVLLVAAHATRTDDGSVDIRDHTGALLTPEELTGWPVPPTTLLIGCRTSTLDTNAPLHLVEAALIAGAGQIVASTAATGDEIADRVMRRLMWLMARGQPASQALQSALQQVHRAYPELPLPFVHTGVPGCACR